MNSVASGTVHGTDDIYMYTREPLFDQYAKCSKRYRIGQIQRFKRHVEERCLS